MDQILSLQDSPVFAFTVLLAVILAVPPLIERLRLPGLVGLLAAGVILGPHGFQLLDSETETMVLLSDIGKIYLMFVAGLEIDLAQFRRTRNRAIGYGLMTFLFPMLAGTMVGQLFGFGLNSSILIGSLLASHTLLGYPIVSRLGKTKNEAVTVTIGATIFTDTGALLVLAICVAIGQGDFSAVSLLSLLVGLGLYAAAVLFGLDWAGKEFFRRSGDEQGNQFLFVLLAVFLSSVGAQIVGVEKIVGAFLAGLAVNDAVGNGPVKEKVEFVGSVLFIPFFFVDMGLLLDVSAFAETMQSFGLVVAIAGALLASKFLAAFGAKVFYRYSWAETLTMWSLSIPQVAATLAAALVGLRAGLIDASVFNSVIVLMLITAVGGPLIVTRVAGNLPIPEPDRALDERSMLWERGPSDESEVDDLHPFTVVVPVYNPLTERYLIELAALIARHENGRIVPLSVARGHVHMDDPQIDREMQQSHRLLGRALALGREFEVPAEPDIRIDDDVAQGISRASREHQANLIVMGWSPTTGFRARLFGSTIDGVFWAAHCPVAVTRLMDEPENFRRILVPIKGLIAKEIRALRFSQILAAANHSHLTLLHVCDPHTPEAQDGEFSDRLAALVTKAGPQVDYDIHIVRHDDPAQGIVEAAVGYDLVVLRSIRRRTTGGLAIGQVTTIAVKELTCSLIVLGEPHS